MIKIEMLIERLNKVLIEIENETIYPTIWNLNQLKKVVKPEMVELLHYAESGTIYFKFGRKQKLLQSTYLMTDTLEHLDSTELGKCITSLQELYYKM